MQFNIRFDIHLNLSSSQHPGVGRLTQLHTETELRTLSQLTKNFSERHKIPNPLAPYFTK